MGYIGNDLQVAYPNYTNIDDISGSFNGVTTSFALTVGGVAPVPAPRGSNQCMISVGGVIQRPDDTGAEGFRLSGGNIVFSSAPNTGEDFFGIILAGADYVNVGANFPSGTAAVPSITFDSDLDTGILNPAANELAFTTGGTQRLSISSAGQLSNNLGTAGAPSYTFTGDVNTGIYSPGADQVAISTNGTGRLFINSSGSVGIGTSTPSTLLEIKQDQDANTRLRISNATNGSSATAGIHLGPYGGNWYLEALASASFANPLRFAFDGTERFRFTSDGRLGIGTTGPAVACDVVGQVRASTGILFGSDTAAANALDDYEEGTWTPSFSGGSGTPNTMCIIGHYVKIGRVVYITLNATSVCGGSGATFTQITGLPYTASQTGGETKFQMAPFYQRDNDNSTLSGAVVSTYAGVFQNTSTLQMSSTVTIPSNSKSYHLCMTYYTN